MARRGEPRRAGLRALIEVLRPCRRREGSAPAPEREVGERPDEVHARDRRPHGPAPSQLISGPPPQVSQGGDEESDLHRDQGDHAASLPL